MCVCVCLSLHIKLSRWVITNENGHTQQESMKVDFCIKANNENIYEVCDLVRIRGEDVRIHRILDLSACVRACVVCCVCAQLKSNLWTTLFLSPLFLLVLLLCKLLTNTREFIECNDDYTRLHYMLSFELNCIDHTL